MPTLRFTPTAWAKLLFLRDVGDTEIGGFGVCGANDPLLVEDVCLVRQRCTAISVVFDDGAVADYFDDQVDAGLQPEQFSRIWLHTHPGNSPLPSSVDETTFERVFGAFHWSVMGIVARDDSTYARLQYRIGPGGSLEIPVGVNFGMEFGPTDQTAWRAEYAAAATVSASFELWDDVSAFDGLRDDFDWPYGRSLHAEVQDGTFGLGSV